MEEVLYETVRGSPDCHCNEKGEVSVVVVTTQNFDFVPRVCIENAPVVLQANGEAAHLSARKIDGSMYVCAGSKNVHLLVKGKGDIEKYTDQRFTYAREIAHTVLDLLEAMEKDMRKRLLKFLCETKLTAVMEMLSPKHQHVEDFSDLKMTELKFITWTSSRLEAQEDTLCCMPPHVGIDIAESLGENLVSQSVRQGEL